MSASYVRAALRAKVAPLLDPLGFTYVDSINDATRGNELPPRWFTLEFLSADDVRAALGAPALFRETGTASLLVFTEQQIGDSEALAACESLRAQLCNFEQADAQGNALRVLEAGPPTDVAGGDFRGAWYGLSVDLGYTFDRFA